MMATISSYMNFALFSDATLRVRFYVIFVLFLSLQCYAFSFDYSAGSEKRARAADAEDCSDDEQ